LPFTYLLTKGCRYFSPGLWLPSLITAIRPVHRW